MRWTAGQRIHVKDNNSIKEKRRLVMLDVGCSSSRVGSIIRRGSPGHVLYSSPAQTKGRRLEVPIDLHSLIPLNSVERLDTRVLLVDFATNEDRMAIQ
jgi:hypothetical protein